MCKLARETLHRVALLPPCRCCSSPAAGPLPPQHSGPEPPSHQQPGRVLLRPLLDRSAQGHIWHQRHGRRQRLPGGGAGRVALLEPAHDAGAVVGLPGRQADRVPHDLHADGAEEDARGTRIRGLPVEIGVAARRCGCTRAGGARRAGQAIGQWRQWQLRVWGYSAHRAHGVRTSGGAVVQPGLAGAACGATEAAPRCRQGAGRRPHRLDCCLVLGWGP
jgi:hypothetical protein